jgi:hypothetical protein
MLRSQNDLFRDLAFTFGDIKNKPVSMHISTWRSFNSQFKHLGEQRDRHRVIEVDNKKFQRVITISCRSSEHKLSYMTLLASILEDYLRCKGFDIINQVYLRRREPIVQINIDFLYDHDTVWQAYASVATGAY